MKDYRPGELLAEHILNCTKDWIYSQDNKDQTYTNNNIDQTQTEVYKYQIQVNKDESQNQTLTNNNSEQQHASEQNYKQPNLPTTQELQYSGKTINDLGQYDSCLQTSNYSYFCVNYNNFIEQSAFQVGLCLPSKLNIQTIQSTIRANLSIINELVPTVHLNPAQLFVQQPATFSLPTNSWQYILVVTLFILLCIFNMLGLLSNIFTFNPPEYIQAFDPVANCNKVFGLPERRTDVYRLEFFEGVRAIAILAVVYGHQFVYRYPYSINLLDVIQFQKTYMFSFLSSLQYSVDMFFYLSGFFIAYSIIGRDNKLSIKQYLLTILNRYLRLMPIYLFCMLFLWQLLPRIGDGPQWHLLWEFFSTNCNRMWPNILLIDNIVSTNGQNYCYGIGWYLSNDFQLFIVSLLPIAIYKSKRTIIAKLIIILYIMIQLSVSIAFNLNTGVGLYLLNSADVDVFNDAYDKPWHRCCPYYLGLLTGILFVEFKHYINTNNINYSSYHTISISQPILLNIAVVFKTYRWTKWFIYSVCTAMLLTLALIKYSYFQHQWSLACQQTFNVLERPVFTVALMGVLLPPLLQLSTHLAPFLSSYLFKFLSKISYTLYLVHYQVVLFILFSSRQNTYFDISTMNSAFYVCTFFAIIVAILAQIFIEIPFANLTKMLFSSVFKTSAQSNIQKNKEYVKLEDQESNDKFQFSMQQRVNEQ